MRDNYTLTKRQGCKLTQVGSPVIQGLNVLPIAYRIKIMVKYVKYKGGSDQLMYLSFKTKNINL